MFPLFVDIQREIYLALADHIKAFAAGDGWAGFLAFLPLGVVFGAVHAVTPGHSKTLLATYVSGSGTSVRKALLTAFTLSATHVTMSVAIVLLSLPLVNIMFGGSGPGSSPVLESVSRGLLGLIGLWLLVCAFRRSNHTHRQSEGIAFGFTAGLIPCPLTLFVMTFAVSRGVPEAGLLFAVTMLAGVATTLAITALASTLFRKKLDHLLTSRPNLLNRISRITEGITGLVLAAVAVWQFL